MDTKTIARQAIIAALYAALCILLAPISYGAVQLRISEMLMVLPFYDRKYTIGLTLGCFIANIFSPELGLPDIVFGTLATLIACVIVSRAKALWQTAVVAAAVNGLIIGAMLYFVLSLPFWLSAGSVAAGELCAVLMGVLAMKALERNEAVMRAIEG